MGGQVEASMTAAVLIAAAVFGRHRLPPFIRSTLLGTALVRLVLPPFLQSPWSEGAADLPLVDDGRSLIAITLQDDRMFVAAGVTVAISLVMLVRLAWQVLATQRRLVSMSDPAPEWLQTRARSLASPALVVDVRVSDTIGGPMAAGLGRRLILLPRAILALPPDSLDAVLAHELGHHERRDLLWIVAARLVTALAWFNPLAHVAATAIVSAREDGSDDWALARTSADRFDYARALLLVARRAQQGDWVAVGAHPMGRRLRRLLDGSCARDRHLGWLPALTAILIGAAALPGAHPVRASHPTDAERVVIVIRK